MSTESTLIIFAIVAALGLIGVVAVNIILTSEEAEARGCRTSTAVNASQGRCFNPGPN
jgi:Flp pilus assembly protein CpaB